MELDPGIARRIHNLRLNYTNEPQPDLLICIPNRYQGKNYTIVTRTSEFTSLCPLNTGQPDYATIIIEYVPNDLLVELKSLKFYYGSFRTAKIFHEDVPNKILDDLVVRLRPKKMKVVGNFTIRGGLHTDVICEYKEPQ